MATASEGSAFAEAVERLLAERPRGYEHLLDHLDALGDAYRDAIREDGRSPHFTGPEQFDADHVYAAMERIAGLSAAAGGFRRPCCSQYPFTWPICDSAC